MPEERDHELALLNNLPDALILLNHSGHVQWLNHEARRLFALLPGQVAWETQPEAFGPDYSRAHAEQRAIHLEIWLPTRQMWHEVCVFPLPDGIGVSFRDITGRKQAEEALRKSEERLRAVYDNSLDAVGSAAQGVHVLANPAYLALFGFARLEDLVGVPVLDLIAPSERETIRARMQRRQEGKDAEVVYETRGLRTDGQEIDLEFHVSTYEQEGEIYTVVALRDITGRKRAERELRESEVRYSLLTENLGVGIWQVTPNGQTIYCNPVMRAMLEADSQEEITARDYHSFFSEESREIMKREHAARPAGEGSLYEVEIIGARGGRRSVMISGSPLFDGQGRLHSLLGTFTDITERKQAEQARQEAEEQYRSIVENAREGLYQTSPDGRLLSANPALAHLLGYASRSEMRAAIRDIKHQVYVDPNRRAEFVRRLETQDALTDFEITDLWQGRAHSLDFRECARPPGRRWNRAAL